NSIGTNLYRSSPIANGGSGVRLAGTVGATVGGTLVVPAQGQWSQIRADVGNAISGNRGDGVTVCDLDGVASTDNRIARNDVGLPPRTNGTQMGNGGWGVSIVNSSANTVGGSPPLENANVIGWNGRGGVAVRSDGMPAERNAVAFNAIMRNGGLGIDLGADGVTPND